MKNDTIRRYVKNKKGVKIGLLIGTDPGNIGIVRIGWSLCRPGDTFSRELGHSRAISNLGKPIPPSLEMDVKRFRVQCFLYFKEAKDIQNFTAASYGLQPRKPRDGLTHNSGHRSECSEGSRSQSGCDCRELAKAEEKVNREPEMVALG